MTKSLKKSTKKYTSRPSPPYPANEPKIRGTVKRGNDGTMYKSKLMGGVHKWMRVTQLTKQRKIRSRKSRKSRANTREKKPTRERTSRRRTRRRSRK